METTYCEEFLSSRALCIYFIVSDKINGMFSVYGKVIWGSDGIDISFINFSLIDVINQRMDFVPDHIYVNRQKCLNE